MCSRLDLTGKKYGRLYVIGFHHNNKKGLSYWKCKCDCGNEKIIRGTHLQNGISKSCGCLHKEIASMACQHNFQTHGESKTRLYKIWAHIKARCYNKNNKAYLRYGGRGISMCDEWKNSFINFKEWAENNGYLETLSIDRIDNNGNYEPLNCRWATDKQQSNNRRSNILYEYKGKKQNLKAWCEELGKKYKLVWERIKRYNKPFEVAIAEGVATAEEYAEVLAERARARERINELQ